MRPPALEPRLSRRVGVALTVFTLSAMAAVPAQADVLFGLTGGYVAVKSESSRDTEDVLYQNRGFLAFDIDEFNGGTIGGEFLVGAGRFVEVGVGAAYYEQSVSSVYLDYVNVNGREIQQEMKLRVIPMSATARIFPFGRDQGVQPYVGGGVAVLNWKYTESGEFVDFNNRNEVFRDTFTDDGNETTAVFVGGVRFALSDAVLLGAEFRYQGGTAELDPAKGFAGSELDLGAYITQATLHIRF